MSRRSLRAPVPVVVLAAITTVGLLLPLIGLVTKAPWSDVATIVGQSSFLDAFRLSLVVSITATALALVLGVPLAWVLARSDFPGRNVVRAIALLPMVLPPVVSGTALLMVLGRNGAAGELLDRLFGLTLPFTTAGTVVAALFVSMPFLVLTAEAGFRSGGEQYDEMAAVLGARPWTRFRRVTLPLAYPSILAGAVLCWARALGEFGATITFAGNVEGRTRTMPLAVFEALNSSEPGTALVLSMALLAVSITVLVVLRDRWWPR